MENSAGAEQGDWAPQSVIPHTERTQNPENGTYPVGPEVGGAAMRPNSAQIDPASARPPVITYRGTPSLFRDGHQNASPPDPADATPTPGSRAEQHASAVGHQTQAPQPVAPLSAAFATTDQDWLNGYVLSDCSEPVTPQRTEHAPLPNHTPAGRAPLLLARNESGLAGTAESMQPRGSKRPRTGSSPPPFQRNMQDAPALNGQNSALLTGAPSSAAFPRPLDSVPRGRGGMACPAFPAGPAQLQPEAQNRGLAANVPPGFNMSHDPELANYIARKTEECNMTMQLTDVAGGPSAGNPSLDPLDPRNPLNDSLPAQTPISMPSGTATQAWESDLVTLMREEPELCRAFIQNMASTRGAHRPAQAEPPRLSTSGYVMPTLPQQRIGHIAHFEIPAPPRKPLWTPAAASAQPKGVQPTPATSSSAEKMDATRGVDMDSMDVDAAPTKPSWPAAVVGDFSGPLGLSSNVPSNRTLQSSVHAWPTAAASETTSLTSRDRALIERMNGDLPEDPEQRASELTRTGILTVMAKPLGDFPEKHARDPFDLVRGMLSTTVESWDTCPKNTYFAVELLGYSDQDDPVEARRLVIKTVTALTGATNFRVDTPLPPGLSGPEGDFSPLFIVSEMPPVKTTMLKVRRVWPTPDASLYVHRALMSPSQFFLAYFGFLSDEEEHVRRVMLQNFLSPAFLKVTVHAIAKDPRTPKNADLETVARKIFSQLRIVIRRVVGGRHHGAVSAVLYCEPPTSDFKGWVEWRDRLMELPITSNTHPGPENVRILPPMRCSCCHAGDHNYSDCPFRILPGWYGPPRFQPAPPAAPPPPAGHVQTAACAPAGPAVPLQPAPHAPQQNYQVTHPPAPEYVAEPATHTRAQHPPHGLPGAAQPAIAEAIAPAAAGQHARALNAQIPGALNDQRARMLPQQPRFTREDDYLDAPRSTAYAPRGRPFARAAHRNRARQYQPPQPQPLPPRAPQQGAYGAEDYGPAAGEYDEEYVMDGYAPPPYGPPGAYRGPPPPYYGNAPRGGGGRRGGRPYAYFPFPQ